MTSWFQSRLATDVDFNCQTCYGSEKKANRKWKETGFQCRSLAKMFPPVPFSSLATQCLLRGFCMRVRGSS